MVADSLFAFGVLAVADGIFGLFGSECWDELLIGTWSPPHPHIPIPNKPFGFCAHIAPQKKERQGSMILHIAQKTTTEEQMSSQNR